MIQVTRIIAPTFYPNLVCLLTFALCPLCSCSLSPSLPAWFAVCLLVLNHIAGSFFLHLVAHCLMVHLTLLRYVVVVKFGSHPTRWLACARSAVSKDRPTTNSGCPLRSGAYGKLEHPPQTPSTVVDYATQNAGLTYHYPMAHTQQTRALYAGSNALDIVSTGCRPKSEVSGTLDRRSLVNSIAAVSAILIAGHQ